MCSFITRLLFAPVLLSLFFSSVLSAAPVLTYPSSSDTVYVSIPRFDWEDEVAAPYVGEYEIQIDDDAGFTSLVDSDVIPAIVSHYSPNLELSTGQTYYWRVRYIDDLGSVGAWSSAQNFALSTPQYYDVLTSDDWSDIKAKAQLAVDYTTNNPGAGAELRFPVNGVFDLVQEGYDASDRSTEYLIFLEDADNVVVNGRDSIITIRSGGPHNQCGFFYVRRTNHIQLKNVTVDYAKDSLMQYGGVISNLNKTTRTFDVTVDHSVYHSFEEMADYADGYFLDSVNNQKVGDNGTIYHMEDSWRNARIGANVYRFTAGAAEWGRYQGELENGDLFITSHRGGQLVWFFGANFDTVVSGLTSKASRGVLFISRLEPGNPNYWTRSIGNRFLRSGGRYMGASSGGVNDKTFGSWYEDNRYEYTRDDAFHNGEEVGEQAVVRNNTMIGAFRNSLWLQSDRTWAEGNVMEYGGELGMQLGGAGLVTAGSPLELLNHALIRGNTVRKSRMVGIEARTNYSFFPDPEVGYSNRNLRLIDNVVEDHLSDQGILLAAVADSEISGNEVKSTQSSWQYYSDPAIELGFSVVDSDALYGSGNTVTDTRIVSGDEYVVTAPSTDISFDVDSATPSGTEPPASLSHLSVLSDGSNLSLEWPASSDPNFASYSVLRNPPGGTLYEEIASNLTVTEFTSTAPEVNNVYDYAVAVVDSNGRVSNPTPAGLRYELDDNDYEDWKNATLGAYSGTTSIAGNLNWSIKANNFEIEIVDDGLLDSRAFARTSTVAIPGGSLTGTDAHSATLSSALDGDDTIALQFHFQFDSLTTLGRHETFVGVRDASSGARLGVLLFSSDSSSTAKVVVGSSEYEIVGSGLQVADEVWGVTVVFDKLSSSSTQVDYHIESPDSVIATGVTSVASALSSNDDPDEFYMTVRQRSLIIVDSLQVSAGSLVDTTAPAAPGNLVETGQIYGGISLDWDDNAAADFDHYRVYQATQSSGPYTLVLDDFKLSYATARNLQAGTQYYFKVAAVDLAGNESVLAGPLAGYASVTKTPQNLVATAQDGSIYLDWSDVTESTFASYEIQRSDISYREYSVLAQNVSNSEYTDSSVVNGQSYYYKVYAVDTSGNKSKASSERSAVPGRRVFLENFDTTGIVPGSIEGTNSIEANNSWALNATNFVTAVRDETVLGSKNFGRDSYSLVSGGSATATDRHTAPLISSVYPPSDTVVLKARLAFESLTASGRAEARFMVVDGSGGTERYTLGANCQTSSAPFKFGVNNATISVGTAGEQDTNSIWEIEAKFTRVNANSTTVSYTVTEDGVVQYSSSGTTISAGLSAASLGHAGIELRERSLVLFDEVEVSYE